MHVLACIIMRMPRRSYYVCAYNLQNSGGHLTPPNSGLEAGRQHHQTVAHRQTSQLSIKIIALYITCSEVHADWFLPFRRCSSRLSASDRTSKTAAHLSPTELQHMCRPIYWLIYISQLKTTKAEVDIFTPAGQSASLGMCTI